MHEARGCPLSISISISMFVLASWLSACMPEPDELPEPTTPTQPPTRPAEQIDAGGHVAVIVPARAVDVAPTVTGELVEITVWPGDSCHAGDVLARIDDSAVHDELAVVEAELRQQRAALRHAQVDAQQSKARARELGELATAGHASTAEHADAQFEARRREANLEAAEAAVAESRARIARLRRQLEDSSIVAHFDGVVARRYLDEGAVTGPGVPIVRIIAGEVPWVRFGVEPTQFDGFELGRQVRVRLDSGVELPARIEHIAPELDAASEMVFIDASLLTEGDRDVDITIGMPALVFASRAPGR